MQQRLTFIISTQRSSIIAWTITCEVVSRVVRYASPFVETRIVFRVTYKLCAVRPIPVCVTPTRGKQRAHEKKTDVWFYDSLGWF